MPSRRRRRLRLNEDNPGISAAGQRRPPAFAPQTFKQWFRQRGQRNAGKPRVILWPDTFTNHFHPETAKAAVEVLEAAGYQVEVPAPSLCCGRPLYDYGMLDLAERLLRQILEALRPQIAEGMPVIVLELKGGEQPESGTDPAKQEDLCPHL
jgi:Fe-S oxidoreductase